MGKQHNRRIFAGFYKQYDGKLVYVITVAKDADTNEPVVIYHYSNYSDNTEYLTMKKASFCEMVEIDGKYVDRFSRQTQMRISDWKIMKLQEDGFTGPKRKQFSQISPDEYTDRTYRTQSTYEEYAKDICENYDMDLRKYRLCMERKRYIGVSKEGFVFLKSDLSFIGSCLKTVLKEYNDFFNERYIQHKSIRKYAADHDMNRGSVEHLQRKFIKAFAIALKQRDDSDGKCRLNQKHSEE